MRGDAVQIQQVILNLALNAKAAMSDGVDGPRRLNVETGVGAGDTVEVWVRDTGVGVKEEDLEHIFKPFVTTKVAGLGMGLSITRSIVEAHGGRIPAECNGTEALVFGSRFRPAPVPADRRRPASACCPGEGRRVV